MLCGGSSTACRATRPGPRGECRRASAAAPPRGSEGGATSHDERRIDPGPAGARAAGHRRPAVQCAPRRPDHLDDRGNATLEIQIRDELRQQFGFVHGGVLAYAADNALTFAAGGVLGPAIVTSGMSIEYLRPARDGRIEARASVVSSSRRRAVCRCDVYVIAPDGAETLCATAQGSATVLRQASESQPISD